ncbi:hypothetical protein [Actinomycetospora flava]|uniref:Oligosaccharide repeat unit polymerase n=1 Tax=Actinomycetospora flava TaxID=3129232 RepID=A0ABU8M537_9PSEU
MNRADARTAAVGYTAAALLVPLGTLWVSRELDAVGYIVLLGTPLLLAVLVRRTYLDTYLSPVIVVPAAFVLTAALGVTVARSVNLSGNVSVQLALNDEETLLTAVLLSVSASALLVGGAIALHIARRLDVVRAVGARPRRPVGAVLSPGRRTAVLAVAATPLLVVIGIDGTDLLSRNNYLIGEDGSLAGPAATVGMAGVIACGMLLNLEEGARRIPPAVVAVGYLLLYFSLGSRQMALCPVLLAVGFHVARPFRGSQLALVAAAVVALALLPLPLFLRGGGEHGLFPYLAALPDAQSPIQVLAGALDNVFISFPLIGATAFQFAAIPRSTMWIELNPLPGDSAGWYDVASSVRINPYTPYATIGELGNHGWVVVVVFWLIAGLFLGYLAVRIPSLTAAGHRGMALVLTALPLLFILYSLQYNLRSSVRLLVYAALIDLAWRAVCHVRDLATTHDDPVAVTRTPVPAGSAP